MVDDPEPRPLDIQQRNDLVRREMGHCNNQIRAFCRRPRLCRKSGTEFSGGIFPR